ncbi:ribonuclease T2-like [Brachionichthys hirsutus]|uniref:ribonuclease T2-like n=1 Tax=Brachionichthys hirsutus TaxID=412623 RepID=UPI0036051364
MRCSLLPLLVALKLLLLPDQTNTQEVHLEDYKYGHPENNEFCSWRCLHFTLQWPAGFCLSLDTPPLCQIPQTVNDWTIHGLWPLWAEGRCDCWPMFQSDVEELEAQLEEHWPSFLKTKSSFQFWRAEWQKHGACAACVEGMNSPLRYFQISLKLRQKFDIQKLLEDAGITPSCDRPYKVREVHQVLAPHLGDKHEIQCVQMEDKEAWFQVKVLLSRNLTIGCDHPGDAAGAPEPGSGPTWRPSHGHPCPPDVPFYYLPIDHQQPLQPCSCCSPINN